VANRNNNQVYYNTEFTNRGAAESEARTWLSQNGHNPNDFEVRTREGSRSDAAQSGIIDIEPDIEVVYPGSTADLQRQRATPGTFSGAWKVLVNGEEVYRFSGVGNNQSDANRVAAQWLRNNGRGVSGEGFEVYPIMTEGVAENFADGRNPQDKGDSKRHGVPTKASVSTLRKVAKQGGRKGQLAHWMANMKAGRAKAKRNK
jgi:hypothetical protein